MSDAQPFTVPCSLTTTKYQLNSSDRKLNLLEHRMTGPSKDGQTPITPPEDAEVENIKIKLFQIEQQSTTTKSNSRSNNSSQSQNAQSLSKHSTGAKTKDGDLYDFLLSKRNHEGEQIERDSKDNKFHSMKKNKNSSTQRKNKKGRNKIWNSLQKNSKLKDYYKSSSSSSLNTSLEKGDFSLLESSSFEQIPDAEEYVEVIRMKNKIIEEKDNEISQLRKTNKELEDKYNALNNYYKSKNDELEKCQTFLIKFIKENEELKRQILRKEINDKQYSLGKLVYQHLSNGQILEYFEEGVEFKQLAKVINDINNKKEELNHYVSSSINESNSQNQLVKYKLSELEREESEIKQHKEILQKEKTQLIHDINLLREESKCFYYNKWTLLGNRYQLVSLLGRGGFSEVYKAYDIKQHIFVACKIHQLNPNWKEEIKDSYIKHTIRENQIMKEINHKNIVKHYDTIEINNNSFSSVLELCNGNDLGSYIKERKKLSEIEAKIITHQILDALCYLNTLNKKIVHYDLKPQNIIFNDMEVKLTDFGLAKIIEPEENEINLTSQGVGTYYYLPPECFDKGSNVTITSKVDIWSLGIVLYEMIYGMKPFGNNYSQEKYVREKVYTNARELFFDDNVAKVSNECKMFIRNCLRVDQRQRYDAFEAINSSFIQS